MTTEQEKAIRALKRAAKRASAAGLWLFGGPGSITVAEEDTDLVLATLPIRADCGDCGTYTDSDGFEVLDNKEACDR